MFYVPSVLSLHSAKKSKYTWCGIETYWAKVRSGKTYHVVKNRVLTALKEGRNVFCNIDFGKDLQVGETTLLTSEQRAGLLFSHYLGVDVRHLFHLVPNSFFTEQLGLKDTNADLTCVPHGSRIIIDEAQNIFPVTGYKSAPENFFKLLTFCGHFDIDFCFITQNPALLDKRIISTSSELIMLKNLGLISSFLNKGYRCTHHQNLYDREPFDSSVHKFDTDIFQLYKSADSIVKHKFKALPIFLITPILGVLIIGGVIVFGRSHFTLLGGKSDIKPTTEIIQTHVVAPTSLSTIEPVIITPPVKSASRQFLDALNEIKENPPPPRPSKRCTYFTNSAGTRSSFCSSDNTFMKAEEPPPVVLSAAPLANPV